jgi:hypothetical protein
MAGNAKRLVQNWQEIRTQARDWRKEASCALAELRPLPDVLARSWELKARCGKEVDDLGRAGCTLSTEVVRRLQHHAQQ